MSEPRTHVYESTTLGTPALKMVLVHARNEAQNAASQPMEPLIDLTPIDEPLDKEQAVRKIIQHLEGI